MSNTSFKLTSIFAGALLAGLVFSCGSDDPEQPAPANGGSGGTTSACADLPPDCGACGAAFCANGAWTCPQCQAGAGGGVAGTGGAAAGAGGAAAGSGGAAAGAGGAGTGGATAGAGGGTAGAGGGGVAACPQHTDLGTVTLPCDCFGTIVSDPYTEIPCPNGEVHCCPGRQAPVCE